MKECSCLTNHFLIAMPGMNDPHFLRSVIYVAEHNQDGALGVLINRPTEVLLSEVLKQMDIIINEKIINMPVLYGGPLHQERGFVLHSPFGQWRSSLAPSEKISITTSKDILQAIVDNHGPEKSLLTLGYAGWGSGQLEEEVLKNTWLCCEADPEIIFNTPYRDRWEMAAKLVGIQNINLLSDYSGHD